MPETHYIDSQVVIPCECEPERCALGYVTFEHICHRCEGLGVHVVPRCLPRFTCGVCGAKADTPSPE